MKIVRLGAVLLQVLLMACAAYAQQESAPAMSPEQTETFTRVVKPACRIIGNYPLDPFDACREKGRELIAAGRHPREVYLRMCGEIFRFKSTFAYAAYYCFSKAALSSRDQGLEAVADACEERHPADMPARWLCVEEQAAKLLGQESGTD